MSLARILPLLVVALVVLVAPPGAMAQQFSSEEYDAAAQLIARGSPQAFSPGCASTCADLWEEEHRLTPDGPASTQLVREFMGVRISTKSLPSLKKILQLRVHPVVAAATVTWEIATILRTTVFEAANPVTLETRGDITHFSFVPKNTPVCPVWNPDTNHNDAIAITPADGWIAESNNKTCFATMLEHPGNWPTCSHGTSPEPEPIGGGWTTFSAIRSTETDCGTERVLYEVFWKALLPPRTADGTIGPHTREPDGTPPNMGQGDTDQMPLWPRWNTLRPGVQAEIDSGTYPLLRQWLEYHLYHPGVADPLGEWPTNATQTIVDRTAQILDSPNTEEKKAGTSTEIARTCRVPLWHYTDATAAATIYGEKRLFESDENPPYPRGAYATTITPLNQGLTQPELSEHLFHKIKPVDSWVLLCWDHGPNRRFRQTRTVVGEAPDDYWHAPAPAGEDDVPIEPAAWGTNPMPSG